MMKSLGMMLTGLVLLGGCASSTKMPEPVREFDIQRYSGRWYEIARLPHRFERGLVAVTADYTPEADGSVRVVNRGYLSAVGKWRTSTAKAYFKGQRSVGLLSVSFFWPFSGEYRVIRLDQKNYAYAVVTGNTNRLFWILSRTPTMDKNTLAELMAFAKASGFDTSQIEFPDQTMNLPTR
jgi:apolipoprotein D and lipocalin family protein